jgi:hypothetical protein
LRQFLSVGVNRLCQNPDREGGKVHRKTGVFPSRKGARKLRVGGRGGGTF